MSIRANHRHRSIRSNYLGKLAALAMCSLPLFACAADAADDDEGSGSNSDAVTGSVNLKYEGTCEFLRKCSKFSRDLPAGQVRWGCSGIGSCSNSGKWVAAPTGAYCGQTVQLCNGQRCTNAVVKDISSTGDWEGSNGVLNALGLSYGGANACTGGWGGGQVSVTTGGGSSRGGGGNGYGSSYGSGYGY